MVPFSSRDKSKKDYLVGLDERGVKMQGAGDKIKGKFGSIGF